MGPSDLQPLFSGVFLSLVLFVTVPVAFASDEPTFFKAYYDDRGSVAVTDELSVAAIATAYYTEIEGFPFRRLCIKTNPHLGDLDQMFGCGVLEGFLQASMIAAALEKLDTTELDDLVCREYVMREKLRISEQQDVERDAYRLALLMRRLEGMRAGLRLRSRNVPTLCDLIALNVHYASMFSPPDFWIGLWRKGRWGALFQLDSISPQTLLLSMELNLKRVSYEIRTHLSVSTPGMLFSPYGLWARTTKLFGGIQIPSNVSIEDVFELAMDPFRTRPNRPLVVVDDEELPGWRLFGKSVQGFLLFNGTDISERVTPAVCYSNGSLEDCLGLEGRQVSHLLHYFDERSPSQGLRMVFTGVAVEHETLYFRQGGAPLRTNTSLFFESPQGDWLAFEPAKLLRSKPWTQLLLGATFSALIPIFILTICTICYSTRGPLQIMAPEGSNINSIFEFADSSSEYG